MYHSVTTGPGLGLAGFTAYFPNTRQLAASALLQKRCHAKTFTEQSDCNNFGFDLPLATFNSQLSCAK